MKGTEQISSFLDGERWGDICDQAVENPRSEAAELVNMVELCIDSMIFFAELKETGRVHREQSILLNVINLLNK